MFNCSRRIAWSRRVGCLALLVTALFTSEAQATILIFGSDPSVTGGDFVNDQQQASFTSDRLSFSVFGDYSFVASSDSVTVTIFTQLLLLNPQGTFTVDTSIDGLFASELSGSTARITEYSASSYLFNYGGSPPAPTALPGSTATASIPGLPESLPTAGSDFSASALHLQASASTLATIPPNSFLLDLGQTTTIQFDMLTVGETIDIHLPDNSTLTPASASVPEPHSLGLLALGSFLSWCAARRRRLRTGENGR